ncbi:MAG: hypothetical protein N2485_06080 [bacterium]|nr:hypothetical protein [bacterium]
MIKKITKLIICLLVVIFIILSYNSFANNTELNNTSIDYKEIYKKVYKNIEYEKAKYGDINNFVNLSYEYEGVSLSFRLYMREEEKSLYINNLSETWENNIIRVSKGVKEYWGYVFKYALFIIYKKQGNIYWKIYSTDKGQELYGGFLTSENILEKELKDVYFAPYKKGAFTSLVFFDSLNKMYYQIYYIDIWGRHDLVFYSNISDNPNVSK